MWFSPRYHMCIITPKATDCVDAIINAILDALANNTRFKNTDGKDFNFIVLPPFIRFVDDNGNPRTDISRLMRSTKRFMIVIEDNKWLYDYLSNKETMEEVINYFQCRFGFDEVLIATKDEKVYVCFFMKKSTYSTEEEEQTMSNCVKYVYKLKPVPTGASAKAVVPAYYTTEEAAETARECLWANGEISVKSDITRLTIDTDPPKYKGVILKAELLPPKHVTDDWDDLGAWHIDDYSRIEPISYEDYARLRYPDANAKDEFHEQELIDADSPADLKKWLPYISSEDNCGNRFFYVYFSDKMFRLARHSKGNVALMVSDAYKKFLKDWRDHIIGTPLPSVFTCCNISEKIIKAVDTTAVDIRDKYPDILMVKFSYPDCIKSRRDFQDWDLLQVWQHSKVVWSLDPKTLTDTVGDLSIGVVMGDGVLADVDLKYLFEVKDCLPLVVFGRDEVFLFTCYNKLKYGDYQHAHQLFVTRTMYQDIKDGAFKMRKIG